MIEATPKPVAPLLWCPDSLVAFTGPAISTWIHGVSPTNSLRNRPAVRQPPLRSPHCLTSAMSLFKGFAQALGRGQRPHLFPAARAASKAASRHPGCWS